MKSFKIPELQGLVAAGGFSRRMGRDKAMIRYHELPQAEWTYRLLKKVCEKTYLSCRSEQQLGSASHLPQIHDRMPDSGPMEALLAAQAHEPSVAWLLVACDLPKLTEETLFHLISQRDPEAMATAFISDHDGLPEPLCAIYEPSFFEALTDQRAEDFCCPRKILIRLESRVKLIELPDRCALENFNHPHEAEAFLATRS